MMVSIGKSVYEGPQDPAEKTPYVGEVHLGSWVESRHPSPRPPPPAPRFL
jgi:hypothetical protein